MKSEMKDIPFWNQARHMLTHQNSHYMEIQARCEMFYLTFIEHTIHSNPNSIYCMDLSNGPTHRPN